MNDEFMSYIKGLADKLTGLKQDPSIIDGVTNVTFVGVKAVVVTVVTNGIADYIYLIPSLDPNDPILSVLIQDNGSIWHEDMFNNIFDVKDYIEQTELRAVEEPHVYLTLCKILDLGFK